jgi:rubredoxin
MPRKFREVENKKEKIVRALKLSLLVCCGVLSGCSVIEYFTPAKPPYDVELFYSFRQVELDKSTSANVLGLIHRADYELLSQSKSVIVSTGQQKKGYKTWFDMVAFDENESTAKRKYFFEIDEKPKVLCKSPKESMRFDCDVVLPAKVLNEPYANENAKRIAVLRQILEDFHKDIADVRQDNKALATSGMLVNQAITSVLTALDSSPALATRLSEPAGVVFSDLSLDKGKIQMVVVNTTARMRIRLGSFWNMRVAGDVVYKCPKCGYIYDPFVGDPEFGYKPASSFEVLPEQWVCPVCAEIMRKQ